MEPSESELLQIHNFIKLLNSKKDSIIVVEGKKDERAFHRLGFSGTVCQFHSFHGLAKFADSVSEYKQVVLLLDSDRKGAQLTRRIISQLERRVAIDLSFRQKLTAITKGKARHVEDLSLYAPS